MRNRVYVAFLLLIVVLLVSACDRNKVLRQESVNDAIKEFVATHEAPGSDTYKGTFDDSSVVSVDPVQQYAKTEAVTIAHLTYKNERISNFPIDLKLRFIFRKTLDNKWILTSFQNTSDYGGLYTSDNGHLNIAAQ